MSSFLDSFISFLFAGMILAQASCRGIPIDFDKMEPLSVKAGGTLLNDESSVDDETFREYVIALEKGEECTLEMLERGHLKTKGTHGFERRENIPQDLSSEEKQGNHAVDGRSDDVDQAFINEANRKRGIHAFGKREGEKMDNLMKLLLQEKSISSPENAFGSADRSYIEAWKRDTHSFRKRNGEDEYQLYVPPEMKRSNLGFGKMFEQMVDRSIDGKRGTLKFGKLNGEHKNNDIQLFSASRRNVHAFGKRSFIGSERTQMMDETSTKRNADI